MTKELKGVHGWLTFFIVMLAIGGLLAGIKAITSFLERDVVLGTLYAVNSVLAMRAAFLLNRENPKGLLWARMCLAWLICLGILAMIGSQGKAGAPQMVWPVIWLIYLGVSQRVKNTYQPNVSAEIVASQ